MNVPHLGTTLLKAAGPLAMIGVVIFILHRRKLPLAENLGWRRPPPGQTILWLLLYAAVILGSNYFMNWRGPWDFTEWRQAPLLVDILRVLAVGILGPIAEEITFRGFLFTRFARTRLGFSGAIALTAIVWGVIHYTYSPGVIALLIFDGLLLGMARLKTNSVITPILMHVMWNLYAVW